MQIQIHPRHAWWSVGLAWFLPRAAAIKSTVDSLVWLLADAFPGGVEAVYFQRAACVGKGGEKNGRTLPHKNFGLKSTAEPEKA